MSELMSAEQKIAAIEGKVFWLLFHLAHFEGWRNDPNGEPYGPSTAQVAEAANDLAELVLELRRDRARTDE